MDVVLVTGACGLVGTEVVRTLAAAGTAVVATDLDTEANRQIAQGWSAHGGVQARWADLTDDDAVVTLVREVAPTAIVHLAAIIPPACYANRALARRVNVGATASLVRAAEAAPTPPTFVLASSVAVYGARNPHTCSGLLSAKTPVAPSDLYGGHKVEAEALVRGSGLTWVILRLGGVMTPVPQWDAGRDAASFGSLLPSDGRIQTVDVRDVATAFANAIDTDATGEVFLIGGDASHRLTQGELSAALSGAMGIVGDPPGRRDGDPGRDADWFATDWMDTDRAQEVLDFQEHAWPDLIAEVRAAAGWRYWPMRALAPLLHRAMARSSPYRDAPGTFADPWGAGARLWGDPAPDPAPPA